MSQPPMISVLMPVYNTERYVAQTIDSILAQTYRDFEFLILSNGSTDRSLSMIEPYAARDSRIRLFHWQQVQTVSRARNFLLQKSQGELVAVMDADDLALPDRLARQLEFLQREPTIVCVGGAHGIIDEQGRLLTWLQLPQTDAEIQRLALAGHGSICHPAAMIRRSAILAVGGYNESLQSAEDLDLWLRLGEIGKLANLPEPILKYRIHSSSISGRNRILQRLEAKRACEQAWRRRGIDGTFEAAEPWRPGDDRQSQHSFSLKYGWWAFNIGERGTAAIYGMKAVRLLPHHLEGWRLLACALLKPLPLQTSNPG